MWWPVVGAVAYFGLGLAVIVILGFLAVGIITLVRADRRRKDVIE
jgi:hypothetical protein